MADLVGGGVPASPDSASLLGVLRKSLGRKKGEFKGGEIKPLEGKQGRRVLL